MKHLLALFALTVIWSCKEEPKNYVTLSGTIINPKDGDVILMQGRDFSHTIKLNEDGTFSDTLNVAEGVYMFKHGEEYGQVFLKNNHVTSFTLDTEMFDETLKFEGDGADQGNFIAASGLLVEKHLNEDIFDTSEDEFNGTIEELNSEFESLKSSFKDLDTSFVNEQEDGFKNTIKMYSDYFASKLAIRKEFPAGSDSPSFENYENFAGGTTSLSDLKGQFVYVDVWATWCGPCKREIPFLKTLEADYHGKNIAFVSISVDNGRGYNADTQEEAVALSHEGWKKMIAEKEMGGIQLFADNGWESAFVQGYKINGIPRFILIGPDGKIVNADAPRPSSSAIRTLFDSLNI